MARRPTRSIPPPGPTASPSRGASRSWVRPSCRSTRRTNRFPHVAESFEPADGAKKWIFKIRKGVTFHNGKTLTADDVVATINYHIGPDSKSPAKGVLSERDRRQGRWPRHGGLRAVRRQCRLPLPAHRLSPVDVSRPKAARSSGKRASAPVPTCSSPSSRASSSSASATRTTSAPPGSTASRFSRSSTWPPAPTPICRAKCTTSTVPT